MRRVVRGLAETSPWGQVAVTVAVLLWTYALPDQAAKVVVNRGSPGWDTLVESAILGVLVPLYVAYVCALLSIARRKVWTLENRFADTLSFQTKSRSFRNPSLQSQYDLHTSLVKKWFPPCSTRHPIRIPRSHGLMNRNLPSLRNRNPTTSSLPTPSSPTGIESLLSPSPTEIENSSRHEAGSGSAGPHVAGPHESGRILAWRFWRDHAGLLGSTGVGGLAWGPGWNQALCESPYPRPRFVDCSCGFYALKELSASHPYIFPTVGIVELAGEIIEHRSGYRATNARIVALVHTWDCGTVLPIHSIKTGDIRDSMANMYEVPVISMQEAMSLLRSGSRP